MQTFHTILEDWKAQIDAFLRAIWDDQPRGTSRERAVDMSLMIMTQHDAMPVITEAISHGANGISGIITLRFGDLSIQIDDHTAEQIETGLQARAKNSKPRSPPNSNGGSRHEQHLQITPPCE
ncbi:hypothetical protein KO164_0037 [Thalassospira sp. KO164]|nr:hypothetical protein KO164_0037 [Thalassospira sp. KO164]SEC86394.1 hypothetical protein SAMN04515623_0036 [Thalassospira permensis]